MSAMKSCPPVYGLLHAVACVGEWIQYRFSEVLCVPAAGSTAQPTGAIQRWPGRRLERSRAPWRAGCDLRRLPARADLLWDRRACG